jgi:hypothetical protein
MPIRTGDVNRAWTGESERAAKRLPCSFVLVSILLLTTAANLSLTAFVCV